MKLNITVHIDDESVINLLRKIVSAFLDTAVPEVKVDEPKVKPLKPVSPMSIRGEILQIINRRGTGITSREIITKYSYSRVQVYNTVGILKKEGQIIAKKRLYFPVPAK